MTTSIALSVKQDVNYPDNDGQPMADNTKQFRWITTIQGGLEALFRDDANVFVAGDLLWYPVEGDNKTRAAPDVMVVFGRPKGDRGSYQQWQEENIPPQVVFEVLSPGNTLTEMARLEFYDLYQVEEYYLYDPQKVDLSAWRRAQGRLRVIDPVASWVSPRLGIRFELSPEDLQIYRPDGRQFETYVELERQREIAQARAEQAESQLEMEQQRAEQLAAKLRALGIDPKA